MSRVAVTEVEQSQESDKQVVRCLLLPQKNTTLLLPNTAVAEVTDYTPPETTQHSPDWLLGILSWRGRNIPLIAFENLFGEPSVQEKPRQVAVLNNMSGNPDLPFIAITISSIPRLIHVDNSSVDYIEGDAGEDKDEESGHEAILARMNVAGEFVVLPNIEFIEDRVIQLGIQ
ncbi:MAG TPA: chemotaxis protein CheW [Ectothiorhodospiraceae bacterium]|nr:chemotaxis protein CheW [Ectothiorhodospiraceae bacterium]